MACHYLIAVLLVPALASIGLSTSTGGLSHGITQTTRHLQGEEQVRGHASVGKRDIVDLTGANCASICGGVAGSGPNQADCDQIINALNANNTARFTVDLYSVTSWVQASCTIEYVQFTGDTIAYSYIDLAVVAGYLSNACNAANGYAYGRCIFSGREDAIWVGNTAVSSESTSRT